MICDTWHVAHEGRWTFSQNFRSLAHKRTNRRKFPIGYTIPNWICQIHNCWYFIQSGIGGLFSDTSLPDSYIPNPQLDIISPIGDLRSPIGDNRPNWGYFLLVLYRVLKWWCFEDLEEKDESGTESVIQWMTKVFVEQPRLHRIW